jgi:hypothetical protein
VGGGEEGVGVALGVRCGAGDHLVEAGGEDGIGERPGQHVGPRLHRVVQLNRYEAISSLQAQQHSTDSPMRLR